MTAFLANALCGQNTVSILSLNGDGSSFFKLDARIGHQLLPKKYTRFAIRNYLKTHSVDIAVNVDTGMAIFGIPAATCLHTKVITWEHANFCNNWGSRLFPYIRRYAARHSDAVVVLTERDRRNYETNIRRCRPVTVICNPADPHIFAYKTESHIILSAGHLSPVKRFTLIPEIGKIVFTRHPDWQWKICGEGPERTIIEEKINAYRLEKNIMLAGAVLNMEPVYREAAMYVMTSGTEGLPMVLLEAKSFGLPIVSFDIMTGPAEIVRDGVNGYLTESGNVEAMAARINELIEDTELRQKFSDQTTLDMEKFNRERIIEQWTELMKDLKV